MLYLRRSRVLKAVLLCWLFLSDGGRADPVPDFAINAVVANSATVSTLALEARADFVNIGGVVFDLQAGYKRLTLAKGAISDIANQLSTVGVELSQAISTMTLNRSGPIATYFDPISAAIVKMQKLVTTGLVPQMKTLTEQINNYTELKLLDGFKTMSATMSALTPAVNNLRTAVTQARAASGSSVTVSPTDVRRYVTTRIVSDITNAVRSLKSSLPSLYYAVSSTLSAIQTADQYLVGLEAEAVQRVQDVTELGNTNTNDVNEYVTVMKGDLNLNLLESYSVLKKSYRDNLQAEVEADANFQNTVDGLLADMKPLYDDLAVGGKIESLFTAYTGMVVGLDDDLASFYGTGICNVVQDLLQVLIEGGNHAQFCFSKFGPQVFNFFVLHLTDTEDCYRLQLIRLDKVVDGVGLFMLLMMQDIEDFLENVERCTVFKKLENCVPFLGTEYTTLLQLTETKRDYIYRFVEKETNASYGRLKGCFNNAKNLMLLSGEETLTNLEACRLNGPAA